MWYLSGILFSVAACTVVYPSYFHSNSSKKRKSPECCSIKEVQFFKYPHGEQNFAILGGVTSCKLAVFDLGKNASFGLSFDEEN